MSDHECFISRAFFPDVQHYYGEYIYNNFESSHISYGENGVAIVCQKQLSGRVSVCYKLVVYLYILCVLFSMCCSFYINCFVISVYYFFK